MVNVVRPYDNDDPDDDDDDNDCTNRCRRRFAFNVKCWLDAGWL